MTLEDVLKIKVIMTDKAMDRETMDQRESMLSCAVSEKTEISVDCIKEGPDELDCNTDEAFASPEMVRRSIQAEKEGYDAIVIYCFSDVAIDAIRENVSIPVVAPGETTLAAAGLVCNRYVVITTESRNIARTYRRLRRYAIARDKMSSVRALDVPIGELRKDPMAIEKRLIQVCREAVEKEQIDGVVLGCLGMANYGSAIEKNLPVKVFDPAFIAVAYAEMCVRIGLTHPRESYPPFMNESHVNL